MSSIPDTAFEVLLRPKHGDAEAVLVGEFQVEVEASGASEPAGAAQVHMDAMTVADGLRCLAEGLSSTREE